jgi:hypothetical protein
VLQARLLMMKAHWVLEAETAEAAQEIVSSFPESIVAKSPSRSLSGQRSSQVCKAPPIGRRSVVGLRNQANARFQPLLPQ